MIEYCGKIRNITTITNLCNKTNIHNGISQTKNYITFLKFIVDNKILLIADRNIKLNISWDQLNEQDLVFGKIIEIKNIKYLCRILTNKEWDELIIPHVPLDKDSHWNHTYSWCQDIYYRGKFISTSSYYVLRGFINVSYYAGAKASEDIIPFGASPSHGWRPVLEII